MVIPELANLRSCKSDSLSCDVGLLLADDRSLVLGFEREVDVGFNFPFEAGVPRKRMLGGADILSDVDAGDAETSV